MSVQGWIVAAGWFNLAFAFFHAAFWWLFRWNSELARLRPVNRAIMQVLNVMLTYIFVATACLQLARPEALATAEAGRLMLAGMTGFWLLRAAVQPMFRGVGGWPVQTLFYLLFLVGAALHGMAWRLAS